MNIIKARDVKYRQYANPAHTELLVDAIPDIRDMVFDTKSAGRYTLYFAEQDGYVAFFAHDPDNQRGYGGASFTLRMRDGSTVTLVGPWSSRSEVMDAAGFTPSVEADIVADPAAFTRGYTFRAGHVTRALLDSFGPREYVEK